MKQVSCRTLLLPAMPPATQLHTDASRIGPQEQPSIALTLLY
jgi:hypothetical protein